MRLHELLSDKPIYRITGIAENFLTSLRFNIWGFNEQNRQRWVNLEPGDIIFFHCKGSGSFFSFRQKSVIVGFGVVGNRFFEDTTPLWIDEIRNDLSYPYRFIFSEMYFFSEISINDSWDTQTYEKKNSTEKILQHLIDSGIPLSTLPGFPHMGSYSEIHNENVKRQLLSTNSPLFLFQSEVDEVRKKTKLKTVIDKNEIVRNTTTLTIFDDIRQRILNLKSATRRNNIDELNNAEASHYKILECLLILLREKGYKVLKNNHIDLFAYKDDLSILVEAKSIENGDFISQFRKGMIQILEYHHFDIQQFKQEHNLAFTKELKLLITSKVPSSGQMDYIGFINSLGIKTAAIEENTIFPFGDSIDFTTL